MAVNSTQAETIVIGLGELLWDVFPEGRRAGGAPANFAFHANQLGCRGLPASRVGIDEMGDDLVAGLQRQGISTELIQRDATFPTGTVTVELDAGGHPSYTIHTNVAWDHLQATSDLLSTAAEADAICFGTLAQRSDQSRNAIRQVIAHTNEMCLIVFDVNLRQSFYSRELIEDSLRLADLVKLNDEEVVILTRLLELSNPIDDLAGFSRRVIERFGPQTVCVTRGSRGAFLVQDRETVEIPGRKIEVIDTVGAGDAFTAALVVSLLQRRTLRESGEIANAVGALVASHSGAMPELRSEYRAILESKMP